MSDTSYENLWYISHDVEKEDNIGIFYVCKRKKSKNLLRKGEF